MKQIDSPDVIGISIVGSYARGQESQYRDGDWTLFPPNTGHAARRR